MPSVNATPSWQTQVLTSAESWQHNSDGRQLHVTVDTPANGSDNAVPYHVLNKHDTYPFPNGVTVSYRVSGGPAMTVSRQPIA